MKLLIFIACILVGVVSHAQDTVYPSPESQTSMIAWFDSIVKLENTGIVNGPEYWMPFKGYKSDPFLAVETPTTSSVVYDGNPFENLDLIYDIYGDLIVLKHTTPSGSFFIELDKERIKTFKFHDRQFVQFSSSETETTINGYFEELFHGSSVSLFCKRRKIQRIVSGTPHYLEDDIFYLVKNGKWQKLTGKKSFENLFPEKARRKQLNIFIKSNGISVKKKKEDDLKKIAAFCENQLEKNP